MASGPKLPFSIELGLIDRVTGPMKRVSKLMGGPRMLGGVRKFTSGIADAGKRVAGLAAGLVGMAAAGGAALFAITKSTADAGAAVADAAKLTGLGVEAYQELRFAASRAGVEQATYTSSLQAFTKRLGEAKAGGGALSTIFNKIDPAFLSKLRRTGDTEEALTMLLEKIGQLPQEAQRAAVASAAFSRAGMTMALLAAEGADGIEALRKKARDLGIVLSEEAVRGSSEFSDALDDLTDGLQGAKQSIGTAVMPMVTKYLVRITDWWTQNRPQFDQWVEMFAAKIPKAIEWLSGQLRSLINWLSPLAEWTKRWLDIVGLGPTVVGVLAGLLLVTLVPALAATASAVYALGSAILLTPVGWILMAIAAIVAAFIYWDEIVRFGGKAWDWLRQHLTIVVMALDVLVGGWVDGSRLAIIHGWSAIRDWLAELWPSIVAGAKAAWTGLTSWLGDAFWDVDRWIPDWLTGLLDSGGKTKLVEFGDLNSRVDRSQAERDLAVRSTSSTEVRVLFENAPKGTRVDSDHRGDGNEPTIEMGPALGFG